MGQTAREIRHDIERSRDRMSATLDAIDYKLDPGARMRYRWSTTIDSLSHLWGGGNGHEQTALGQAGSAVGGVFDTVQERVTETMGTVQDLEAGFSQIKENVMESVTSQAQATMETAKTEGRAVAARAKDNALLLGVGAFAAGLTAGLFVPKTRVEEEKIQPLASKLTHRAVEAGEDALQKGEDMAEEALQNMTHPDQSTEENEPQQSQQAQREPEPVSNMAGKTPYGL